MVGDEVATRGGEGEGSRPGSGGRASRCTRRPSLDSVTTHELGQSSHSISISLQSPTHPLTGPSPRPLPLPSPSPFPCAQYDSEDEDLSVFSPGRTPPQSSTPSYPARNYAQGGASPAPHHYASNPDPFANQHGQYDPYSQSQNPASYSGGQPANKFGTAVDGPRQRTAYDPYE